ncbi:MAG: T9SS type A sorting domain-containing protein [Chitinophagales bacterium]
MKKHATHYCTLAVFIFCFSISVFAQDKRYILNTLSPDIKTATFADLDNDGVDEAILCADGAFYVMQADTSWNWHRVNTLLAPCIASKVILSAINGDGLTDIAFRRTTGTNYYIGWLLNPGGIIGEWQYVEDDIYVRQLLGFVDFDNDGDLDLFVEDSGSQLCWKERVGETFTVVHDLVDPYPNVLYYTLYDFDQDGLDDMAAHFYDVGARYLHNNGDGTWSEETLGGGEYQNGVWSADYNNDGYADIVLNISGSIKVAVYQPASGDFNTPITWAYIGVDAGFYYADLDGDGDKEWIIGDHEDGNYRVRYIPNEGGDMLAADMQTIDAEIPSDGLFYIFHDLNGDGSADLLMQNDVHEYMYTGVSPDLLSEKAYFSDAPLSASIVAAFDIDNDGDNDLMVDNANGRLGWLKYDIAADSFTNVQYLPNIEGSPSPGYLQHADLDNDGDVDLIAGFQSSGASEAISYYYINDGSGQFTAYAFSANTFLKTWLRDVDADGDLDLLAYRKYPSNAMVLFLNTGVDTSLFTLFGNIITGDSYSRNFELVDFNNDGQDDIIYARTSNSNIQGAVFTGVPGSYYALVGTVVPTACTNINLFYTDDMDGDGDADITFTCSTGNTYISENVSGTFTNTLQGMFVTDMVHAPDYADQLDVNGDGNPDLIFGNGQDGGHMYYKISNGPLSLRDDYLPLAKGTGSFHTIYDDGAEEFIGSDIYGLYIQNDFLVNPYSFSVLDPVLPYLVENGASDSIGFVLNEIPNGTTEVIFQTTDPIDMGAGAGMPVSLFFDPDSTALIPQFVHIQIPDDVLIEDTTSYSVEFTAGAGWSPFEAAVSGSFDWLVVDNDPGIFYSYGLVTALEGMPTAAVHFHWNVMVNETLDMEWTADPQQDLGDGAGVNTTYTFNTLFDGIDGADITVLYAEDLYDMPYYYSYLTPEISSMDPMFDGVIPEPFSVYMKDNDYANVSYASDDLLHVEGLDSFYVSILFTTLPLFDVDITVAPDAQLDLGAGGGVPLTLHVSATDTTTFIALIKGIPVDDGIVEGSHSGYITFSLTSDDPFYGSLADVVKMISIEDGASETTGADMLQDNGIYYIELGNNTFQLNGIAGSDASSIHVYDMSGRSVFVETVPGDDAHVFSLRDKSSGMYILQVTDEHAQTLYQDKILLH